MKKSGINRSSNNITGLNRGITWSKEYLMTIQTTSAAFYSYICWAERGNKISAESEPHEKQKEFFPLPFVKIGLDSLCS